MLRQPILPGTNVAIPGPDRRRLGGLPSGPGPWRKSPGGPEIAIRRDPEVVFWPSGSSEAWGTKAKNKPHTFTKQNHSVPRNVRFLGLGTPGLQTNTWPETARSPYAVCLPYLLQRFEYLKEIGLPGRILAGLLPGNHRHRPRPEGRFRWCPGSSPATIWPGNQFMARKHSLLAISTRVIRLYEVP